jgi:hypothetical protein
MTDDKKDDDAVPDNTTPNDTGDDAVTDDTATPDVVPPVPMDPETEAAHALARTALALAADEEGRWHAVHDPRLLLQQADRLSRRDGARNYRTPPFLAAAAGAICLVEVMPHYPLPAVAEAALRAMFWLYDTDADGGGPAAFPDAAAVLAQTGRVLIVDATWASALVYLAGVGMAAAFGRVTFVETMPERIEERRVLAEHHLPGRVTVLPRDAVDPPMGAVGTMPGSATVH